MLQLDEAKHQFLALLQDVHPSELPRFAEFVQSAVDSAQKEEKNERRVDGRRALRKIAKELRKEVDVSGNKSQRILWPTEGAFDDCRPETTVEVDSFLYDEADLSALQKSGRVKAAHVCGECKSTNILETTYISHSYSIDELDYLFNELLPPFVDLRSKRLVDIGSRLGAVLFAACLFHPQIEEAVGIEISPEHCRLQEEALKKIEGGTKCSVIEGDFRDHAEVFEKADVVFMNNVFSFFADKATQTACWERLHSLLRPNTLLVHNHSLEFVTQHLELSFRMDGWAELLHPTVDEAERMDVDEEAEHVVCVYRIR